MIWLFIAYPLLSHAALRSFDCVTIGQQRLMRLDMQLDCPMYHPSSAAFSWALVLCVVYPFGIPFFMYSALLYFQVPKVVTKKRQNAVVRALIGSFNAARSKTAPAKLVHHLLGPDGKQQSVSGVVRRMEKCLLPVIREESVAGATLSDGHPHPRPEGLVSDEASITWSAFKTELLHSGVIRAGEDSSELLQLFASAAGDKGDAANPSLCWKNLKGLLWELIQQETLLDTEDAVGSLSDRKLHVLSLHSWGGLGPMHGIRVASGARAQECKESEGGSAWLSASERGALLDALIKTGLRLEAAHQLVVPPIGWSVEAVDEVESRAMSCVGGLLRAYKLSCWGYHFAEMGRKFLLLGLFNVLSLESVPKLALGLFVNILFLIHLFQASPYAAESDNRLQALALAAQCLTLFYGLTLTTQRLAGDSNLAGGEALAWVVFVLNLAVFAIPVLSGLLQLRPGHCNPPARPAREGSASSQASDSESDTATVAQTQRVSSREGKRRHSLRMAVTREQLMAPDSPPLRAFLQPASIALPYSYHAPPDASGQASSPNSPIAAAVQMSAKAGGSLVDDGAGVETLWLNRSTRPSRFDIGATTANVRRRSSLHSVEPVVTADMVTSSALNPGPGGSESFHLEFDR